MILMGIILFVMMVLIPFVLLWWLLRLRKIKKNVPIKLQEEIINARKKKEISASEKYGTELPTNNSQVNRVGEGEPRVERGDIDREIQGQVEEQQGVQVSNNQPVNNREPEPIEPKRKPKKDWPKFE